MEYGRKIEFDHPYILLQNKEGKFSQMVRVTEDGGENLCEIAKKVKVKKKIFFFIKLIFLINFSELYGKASATDIPRRLRNKMYLFN